MKLGSRSTGILGSRLACMETRMIRLRSGRKTRTYNWTLGGVTARCSERRMTQVCHWRFFRPAKRAGWESALKDNRSSHEFCS